MLVLAQKQLPDDVKQPIEQILSWFLGGALIVCLIWFLIAASRFFLYWRGGEDRLLEATGSITLNVLGAAIASSCMGIAYAILG
ncbi:hypothetical protein OHB26_38810 (plasmid) [Nocardia sp. NBC_01503]|uniref:hypothetical protein n=1 Tax=Nocardia sp. NBC_01503 TaxID=2975997 RepID=UPI002E7BEE42|nr:hypothetical protein [Nocardia sp. NBC_01503]WTL36630.1 hypothetical protein OHB26_38810 [Nocardia sp. NBC_01503]